MATELFKAEKSTHELAENVLKGMMADRISLGLLDPNEVVILMREGEMPPKWGMIPGRIKKVTKDLPLLTNKDYNYKYQMIIVAAVWNAMTDEQRRGLLCHLFCHVDVRENENSGEISYGLRTPPIYAFPEELDRHGMWWPSEYRGKEVEEALSNLLKDE